MSNFGFWVDMADVKLDDNNVSAIQGMTLGEYEHPVHGTISLTEERIKRFADNVNSNVRGQELDVDYDHKAQSMEAAGWIKGAEATPQGLILRVEWTKKAAEKIRNKEYRYFSPEFADVWTHPKTKQKFDDVLFGGALTNRPFLKDILPVNLSELFSDESTTGGPMDPKELRKLLGLPETATDAEVRTKLETNNPPQPDPNAPPTPAPAPTPTPTPQPTPDPNSPPDSTPENAQLAELLKLPAFKAFADKMEGMAKRLDEQDKKLREAEVRNKLSELTDNNTALPPAVEDQLVAALSEDKVDTAKVFEALGTLKRTGFVPLSETGRAGQQGGGGITPLDAFNRAVKALMEKDPTLSEADAAERVSLHEPALYEEMRKASYSFKEA